jgi:ABC-type sulfate transport system permease subunit
VGGYYQLNQKEVDMPALALITLVLVSPFMAISLLPTLRNRDEDEDEETIVRWRK